ncbi:hypothetical protein ACQPYK_49670 (plasmid) [Streptosporangium sp. CA-135522]
MDYETAEENGFYVAYEDDEGEPVPDLVQQHVVLARHWEFEIKKRLAT